MIRGRRGCPPGGWKAEKGLWGAAGWLPWGHGLSCKCPPSLLVSWTFPCLHLGQGFDPGLLG